MRLTHTALKMTVAALFGAGATAAAVNLAHAGSPAVATPAVSNLDTENGALYIEHMRGYRRTLNETKDAVRDEKMADRNGNRKEAVEALNKAISAVNTEVSEYEKEMKTGK